MNKLFCPDCGSNNSYVAKKPNFCSSCGYKFASATIGHTTNSKPEADKPKSETVSRASCEDWFEIDQTHAAESFRLNK